LETGKETISTSALDGEPDMILEMPEDSFAPILLTLGIAVLFVGLLLRIWLIIGAGAACTALALLFWMWPRRQLLEREPAHE
jgi:cytochrome c oxidase subunit I+III